MGLRDLALNESREFLKVRLVLKFLLLFCVVVPAACSSTDNTSNVVGEGSTPAKQEPSSSMTEEVDVTNLCESIETTLLAIEWGDYGVKVADCASTVADDGDDVFILTFNDVEEWKDLYLAFGDIPVEDAARYAFWRVPLGLLSISFTIAEKSPNEFDQILIFFNNPKQTVYDILPRDIAYVIDIPDSYSKEEYSTEMNKRIDEVSERVDIYNLND